jgi:hypothetical protein
MVVFHPFVVVSGLLATLSGVLGTPPSNVKPAFSPGHWVDTWAAMPQLTESANLPPPPFVRLLWVIVYCIFVCLTDHDLVEWD